MPQPLKIFISSPGDVNDERRRAALAIGVLKREFARFFDISAVFWEYEPMLSSGHFQDIIDSPSAADIFVLIVWSRLGTPLPPKTEKRDYRSLAGEVPVTGTEWEYEQALQASKQRGVPDLLVYRKLSEGVARFNKPEELDAVRRQWEALQTFWVRHFEQADGSFKAAFNRFVTLDQFQEQLEQHLRELLRRRLPSLAARTAKTDDRIDWWSGSPYRGLQAFDIEHAVVFFGRERAEREIAENLVRHAAGGMAFMLVLGASGSGKSSLVRAGVLPDLMGPGVVENVTTWRHAVIQPGQLLPDPFAALANVLTADGVLPELGIIGYTASELATQFRSDPALAVVPIRIALQKAADDDKNAAPGRIRHGRLILVLDQFEVLFTSPSFTNEARGVLDRFFAKLTRSGLVWLIATLRSDFYHRMVDLPELNALAAGDGQYLLAPPTPAEIEQIITRPAEVAGLSFEVDENSSLSLAATIRDAAARDPASLPLLSFVLDELYRQDIVAADGTVLTNRSYQALGGLEGAIARHADAMVDGLSTELATALPALLLALVETDEVKGTTTARTLRRGALSDPRHLDLADRLVNARIAVADDTGAGETLRLAHEALLNHWPRLQKLIDEHRDFLMVRRRLDADTANWERQERHDDFLLPAGRRLAEAEDILTKRRADLSPEIVAYAEASIAAERSRVAAAERTKEESLRRELKRSQRIAAVVSALFAVALAAGALAWWQRGVATAALKQSEENFRLALDQSTGSLQLLKDRYDAGNISTEVLQSLVTRSQEAVKTPPSPTDSTDILAARVQFLDVLNLINVTAGDSRAMQTAEAENRFADQLLKRDPANPQWLRLWTIARGRLSDILMWQCDAPRAAEMARMSVDSARKLLQANPDDDYLHHRLDTNYETIGDSMRSIGNLAAAEEAHRQFFDDARATSIKRSSDLRWQGTLAFATIRMGDLFLLKGMPNEAGEQYQNLFSIAARLVRESPREANYLSALVQSHQRLGDAFMAQGNTELAGVQYRHYLDRATVLTNLDLSNYRFREIFAFAYQRNSDLQLKLGNANRALEESRTYLRIAEEMLAKDRSNIRSLYNVSNAHQKVGDALRVAGDLGGARQEYETSLTIAKEMAGAATSCTNGTWQKMVPMAYHRMGVIAKAQGDRGNATRHFKACAALPINANVWSPATLWPADVTAECKREAAELDH